MILHPAKHLTSNYQKDEESNNYKLLSLGHLEHMEIHKALNDIEVSRDIDEATGFTLDKAGKNVLELRANRDDEAFRRAIKIKIRSNLSAGTIEDINDIADILFGESYISVRETWYEELYAYEPAAFFLSFKNNPDKQMMFFEYIKNIVMSIKAGGVRLYNRIYTDIPEASIYIGANILSDMSYMSIPMRTLEDMDITSTIYIGVGVSEISFMTIPTADLREVD